MSNALLTPDEIDLKRGQLQTQLGIEEAELKLRKFSFGRRRRTDGDNPKYNKRTVRLIRSDFYIPCTMGRRAASPLGRVSPHCRLSRVVKSRTGSRVVSEGSNKHVDGNAANKHGKYIDVSAMRCEAQAHVAYCESVIKISFFDPEELGEEGVDERIEISYRRIYTDTNRARINNLHRERPRLS